MSNWYCAATGFVPYFDAIQNDLFRNSVGRARFRDDRTGRIYLVASITDPSATGNQLSLYYTGVPDRTPGVSARLKAISKVPGNPANITNIGDAASSANTLVPPGDEDKVSRAVSNLRPHTFNFANHYYYVIITLERSSDDEADINPTAIGVEIRPEESF